MESGNGWSREVDTGFGVYGKTGVALGASQNMDGAKDLFDFQPSLNTTAGGGISFGVGIPFWVAPSYGSVKRGSPWRPRHDPRASSRDIPRSGPLSWQVGGGEPES